MNIKKLIKKILNTACIYFTAIMAIYAFIMLLIPHDTNGDVLISAENSFLYFVFSVLLSLANGIFSLKNLNGAARLISHFIISLFAFYICFMIRMNLTGAGTLVGIVFFSILYFIIAGIIALFKSRFKKNTEKTESYTNQYKKKF